MKRFKKSLLTVGFCACLIAGQAQNLNTPNKRGPLGTQVNVISGNLFIPRTDLTVSARAFIIDISFSYNSYLLYEDVGFGKGWSFKYSIQYKPDTSGGRIIRWGDGREDVYDSIAGGGYKTPLGFFNKLVQYQPGKYRLTELDSTVFFFDNAIHKKITRVQDVNGNFINFNYTDTLLTSLTNADGQTITFTYNSQGRLATCVDAITAPTKTYTYTYDVAGNLTEVKNPLNGKNKYTYLLNGPMKTISDENGNVVDIIYYPDYSTRELVGCNKRVSFSYDTLSKKTIATDHFDNGGTNQVTAYTYQKTENLGWISSVSGNCCGYNLHYEYDDQGNEIKMTDANGQVYKYTYDTKGNMLTMTDPLNQVSTYTYSANYNKIISYKDNKGFLYALSYDSRGNLLQMIAPGNNMYTAAYNAKGDIISSTDPKGNIFTYNYDVYGNPTSVTGPNGHNAVLSFDARGNLLSYTDARGNSSSAEYDILDRLKKITDPINDKVQFTYDANGNIVSVLNKNNEISSINYDASDRVVKLTGPTGNKVNLSYDAMDNLTSVKNALGNETKLYYDTRNRLSASKDAESNNSGMSYDANGNITGMTMPNGQTVYFTYDALNRLTATSDNSGTISTIAYDKNNNITSYTNGTGATTTATYDSLNRIKQVTDPLGNSMAYTYDKNNNIISATDRNGFTSLRTYDSLDRVKTFTDNNGFVITVGYDAMSNVVSLKDQNNNITTYTYDNLNRRKRMTYPGGSFNEYTYDNKGNVIASRLTDGTIITYLYDTLNRVIARQLPGGENYTYSYDALGRIISATNNAGMVNLTYDALNRIISETFDGRTTSYQYNVAGRTQKTVYPDGSIVTKEYDTRNRIIKILKDSVTLVEYAYSNANQLTKKTFANGVISNMQYDFANRLSSISTAGGGIQNTMFTYDKEMNKTAITRQNNLALSEQFTYDNGRRLTNYKRGPAGSPVIQNSYTYDAVGNRTLANLNGTNTNYSINNLNQITAASGGQNISFTYDGRGNLTYDGTFYKIYDAENRLIKDSSSPANVIAYTYDVLNRRVAKTINGNVFKYSYSGIAQIEERNAGNTLLNSTVFNGFLSPVTNDKAGSRYYYHQNELNSVEAISNNSGRLLERYQYDVYGKPSRYDSLNNPLTTSLAGNRIGFTGQEYDSASGSYRFFFRNYSPQTGVFNQRDLIEYGDGMGMYQYVGNNPANGIDVLGLEDCEEKETDEHRYLRQFVDVNGHLTNRLTMIDFAEELASKGFKKSFKLHGVTPPAPKVGLTEIKGIKMINNTAQVAQVAAQARLLQLDAGSISNEEYNIRAAEIAMGASGIANDKVSSSLLAKIFLAPEILTMKTINAVDAASQEYTGKSLSRHYSEMDDGAQQVGRDIALTTPAYQKRFDRHHEQLEYITKKFGSDQSNWTDEWIEMYEIHKDAKDVGFKYSKSVPCPPSGGTRKPNPQFWIDFFGLTEILSSNDPNAIIGPAGQPDVHWVSVKDRMPYTILYENSAEATAPAKYVRITTPIEPKQDANTFLLGSFGFNTTTFTVPPNTSSYYNRLDVRDSLGLYVDITAGYDQMNNVAFWEFQSIDPITLQPPADPLKGFLLLQDSNSLVNGHGFVNFSIKPKQSAITLDTIGARAEIIFDENDTIPTNIHTNTIDAFAPTSHMNTISATTNPIMLSWSGTDDAGGCGIDYYSIYVSTDMVNYTLFIPRISRTDTTFSLPPDSTYCFFVLATDRVGNKETLRPGEIKCTYIGPPLPVTWLHFRGKTVGKNNLLDWATANEQNSKQFDVERSLNGTTFNKIGAVAAAGNSNQTNNYQYTDPNIDRLNSETMFYRLKQIDIDGKFNYSNIVRLRYLEKSNTNTIVYPNPTPGLINILVGDNSLVGTVAVLYDINGRLLENIKITASSQAIDLGKYPNGTYFIRLSNKEVLKVVKN
ncbi:MAG: RHS repeat-associated core domain-containing protein [Ferruginibacter sp.]